MTDVATTDVLVIGGGAAGTNAALKAADRGADVVMVVKGLLGESGCSILASHLPQLVGLALGLEPEDLALSRHAVSVDLPLG